MKLRASSKRKPGYFSRLLRTTQEDSSLNHTMHIEISLSESKNNQLGSVGITPSSSENNSCTNSPKRSCGIVKRSIPSSHKITYNEKLILQLRYLLNHIVIPNMSVVPSLRKLYKEIVKIVDQSHKKSF
uniref:BESS domain-containing protein n=1 Tax=Strongyloides stercoralis TaxID=6248 RepID=A0A0K0E8L0_STRER